MVGRTLGRCVCGGAMACTSGGARRNQNIGAGQLDDLIRQSSDTLLARGPVEDIPASCRQIWIWSDVSQPSAAHSGVGIADRIAALGGYRGAGRS